MAEFFAMGGYAVFVWTAYGITLLALLANFLWPVLSRKRILARLRETEERRRKLERRRA